MKTVKYANGKRHVL